MYPNLSYLLHALFGTQPDNFLSVVQTFGLFLGLSILIAAYILRTELKRKGDLGLFKPTVKTVLPNNNFNLLDHIVNGAILGFIGMKAALLSEKHPSNIKTSDLILSMGGNWIIFFGVLALFIGISYFLWYRKKDSFSTDPVTLEIWPHDRIGDITMIAAISGVVGSKLFSLFEDFRGFLQDPVGQFFSGSGLNIYGGLITGFIAVAYYIRKHNISILHVMDAIAPALIFSYGTGRLGCQLSGDGDWGIVNTSAAPSWWFLPQSWWSSTYPHNVLNEGVTIPGCTWEHCMQLAQPVYPTPIYEIFMAFAIFGILMALRGYIKAPGMIFSIYMVLNGIERWFIEKIRVNDKYDFFGAQLSQAEFIALIYIGLGILLTWYFWKQSKAK